MSGGVALQDGLLTTVAAPISTAEAVALADEMFGLRGEAHPLTSERDQNFRLVAEDGAEFVLKIANPAEDPAVVEFQTEALQHIQRRDPGLPVPRVVSTRTGEPAGHLERPGEPPRIVRMLTFLPGAMLHQAPATPVLWRSLGTMHGRLDLALAGFSHPAADYELLWDLKHAGKLRALLAHIPDPARRALAETALDRFAQDAEPAFPTLRTQVIHNDLNPHNAVVDPEDRERLTGILDFGDMVRAPLVCDVAVAAAYLAAKGDGPLGGIPDYLGAYHAVAPLAQDELDVLFDLIVARLAMTVLITGWRATLQPENRAYILRNNPPAWAGLERLDALSRDAGRALLEDACRGNS